MSISSVFITTLNGGLPPTITYPSPQPIIVQATDPLTGNPLSGIVTLSLDGGTAQTQTLTAGKANFSILAPPGDHTLTAVYPTQGNFDTSSNQAHYTVIGMMSATSINATTIMQGQNGIVTVSVAGSLIGTNGLFAGYQNVQFCGQALGSGGVPLVAAFSHLTLGQNGINIAAYCLSRMAADYGNTITLFGNTVVSWPVTTLVVTDIGLNEGANGAFHGAAADPILYCNADLLDARSTQALFLAELCEVGEGIQSLGWDADSSNGEALSRFMPEVTPGYAGILEGGYRSRFLGQFPTWSYSSTPAWINATNPSLPNWIDATETNTPNSGQQDPIAFGCELLFLYWLHHNRGFTYQQIFQAGAGTTGGRMSFQNVGTLALTYAALTGNPSTQGWTDFHNDVVNLIAAHGGSIPPGPTTQNDDLWVSLTPANPGAAPAIPALPSRNPSGSVSLFVDGNLFGTAALNASGQATFTLPVPAPGSHSLRATYAGQGVFAAATDALGSLSVLAQGVKIFRRAASMPGSRSGCREESYE